jgi:hypothetical protein
MKAKNQASREILMGRKGQELLIPMDMHESSSAESPVFEAAAAESSSIFGPDDLSCLGVRRRSFSFPPDGRPKEIVGEAP